MYWKNSLKGKNIV